MTMPCLEADILHLLVNVTWKLQFLRVNVAIKLDTLRLSHCKNLPSYDYLAEAIVMAPICKILSFSVQILACCMTWKAAHNPEAFSVRFLVSKQVQILYQS